MDYLPIGFPQALIKDTSDFARIHTYCRKYLSEYYDHYHFGHFLMAAYASVPALLTPDLLYRIWMNFNTYQWGNETLSIHRVAVADLLLSGLCKNIGFELYEMPDSIRFPLRKWLEDTQEPGIWQDRGFAKAQDVAAFVEAYHKRDNPGRRRWGKNYHDRQDIGAIETRNPAEAQQRLLQLAEEYRKREKTLDQYRMLDLITRQRDLYQLLHQAKKSDPSSPYYVSPIFEQNALLADLQKAKLQDEGYAIAQLIQDHFDLLRDQVTEKKPPQGESVEVRIPKELGKSIKRKPVFQALLIGVDQYENNYLKPLQGCKNDVTAFTNYFQQAQSSFLSGYTCTISVMTDDSATKERIEDSILNFAQLNHGDTIYIYFAGHSEQHELGTILNLYKRDQGIILGQLIDQLLAIIKEKRLHILFAIDSHLYRNEISTDEHRDLFTQGDLVLLYGSAIKNIALEQEFEGKKKGYFSAKFLEIIREHYQLTYDQCFAKLREAMGEKQVPFIEAVPPLALYNQFLIGSPGKNVYQLDYDEQQDKWRLQAGLRDGITPSAGFISTIIRNSKGVEWKISAIQAAAAEAQLMSIPESPLEPTHQVVVAQNAPFKIRVGLSDGFQAVLELNRRQNNTDLLSLLHNNPYTRPLAELLSESNYFYLVNQADKAELKIANVGNPPKEFYLTKNNPRTWESADQPLLPIVPEINRLNKQLHWISSFLFVKRLEGKDAGLKHRFNIQLHADFQVNSASFTEDGSQRNLFEINCDQQRETSIQINIQYFESKIVYPIYIYVLLFHEDNYSIQVIDEYKLSKESSATILRGLELDEEATEFLVRYQDQKTTSIPLEISQEVLKEGNNVAHKHFVFYFSQQPIDMKHFTQVSFFEPNTWINALQKQDFRVGAFDVRRVEMRLVQEMKIADVNRRIENSEIDTAGVENVLDQSRQGLQSATIESTYPVLYKRGHWMLGGGTINGFVESGTHAKTLVRITDQGSAHEVEVSQVFSDYSLLNGEQMRNFADPTQSYEAVVTQLATPKLLIGIAESLPDHSSLFNALRTAYGQEPPLFYQIDFAKALLHYDYVIRFSINNEYMLTSTNKLIPFFKRERDARSFLRNLDSIAKWVGVAQLKNVNIKFLEKDFVFTVKKVEGIALSRENIFEQEGVVVSQGYLPEEVVVKYVDGLAPAFQLSVEIAPDSKLQHCEVGALYLQSNFKIRGDLTDGNRLERNGDKMQFGVVLGGRFSNTIPLRLNDAYQFYNINEITAIFKIFVSDDPWIDNTLTKYHQDGIALDEDNINGINRSIAKSNDELAISDNLGEHTNWTVFSLKVRLVGPNNTQAVETGENKVL